MNPKQLKKYIYNIYKLESSIYKQNLLKDHIYQQIIELENYDGDNFYAKESYSKPFRDFFYDDECNFIIIYIFIFAILGVILGLITAIILHFAFSINYFSTFLSLMIGGAIATPAIYLIVKIIILIKNLAEIKLHNKSVKLENKNIELSNIENIKISEIMIDQLNREQNIIEEKINDTQQILDEYYSLNIVYPKYRNFVAISSFYEYLSSGRCSQLTGHEGAYNIYETEIRLDRIIVKLDEIIERLDEIKSNQYMLYSEIKKANTQISALSDKISDAVYNLENIEKNTSVTAYYSKISSENTEFLKWMKIFEK